MSCKLPFWLQQIEDLAAAVGNLTQEVAYLKSSCCSGSGPSQPTQPPATQAPSEAPSEPPSAPEDVVREAVINDNNGYIWFTSGLLMQWGKSQSSGWTNLPGALSEYHAQTVTLPKAYDSGSSYRSFITHSVETTSTHKPIAPIIVYSQSAGSFVIYIENHQVSWFTVGKKS